MDDLLTGKVEFRRGSRAWRALATSRAGSDLLHTWAIYPGTSITASCGGSGRGGRAGIHAVVERPLIEQLKAMGWRHLDGRAFDAVIRQPVQVRPDSFDECCSRTAAGRHPPINLDRRESVAGRDADQRGRQPTFPDPATDLPRSNQKITDSCSRDDGDGVPGWEGAGGPVQFIDWRTPKKTTITVVNQVRGDILGSAGQS